MLGEKGAVMTTLEDVVKKKAAEQSAEQQAAVELVGLAQEQGLSLTGPDGLLKQLTKTVLEAALNEEMTEHLGYEKHDRRLSGVDEVVLSLYAKGLTTGEISAHFAEIYRASVSKETISRITDKVIEEMNDWSVRPLDETYAAIFIDAISGDGPRRPGRQPSVLRRHRRHPGRRTRHPRSVGRHRWRGCEVLR